MNQLRRPWPIVIALAAGACTHELDGLTPSATRLEPALVCDQQLTTEVAVTGEGMSPLPVQVLGEPAIRLPALELQRTADLRGAAGTGAAPIRIPDDGSPSRVRWTSQESMSFDVYPELGLADGVYSLTLTNGNGNASTLAPALSAVPPPAVTSVDPDLICVAQAETTITLTGEGFLDVGGTLPTVTATPDGGGDPIELTVSGVEDCFDVAGPTAGVRSCTAITCTIPAGGLPTSGASTSYLLVVTNPAPANCVSAEPVRLTVVPPPQIDSVEPPLACTDALPAEITLTGSGFLVIDGVYPTVTIDGTPVTLTAAGGCVDITGLAETVQSCTSLTLPFPASAATPGVHTIHLENPPPADCSATDVTITVALPPVITGVVPARICSADSVITVTGDNFLPETTVSVGGTAATSTTYVSSTEIQATIPPLPPGVHDVTVSNGAGCEATLPGALTVVENPIVFFVDPPVAYNGSDLQVTVYTSGVVGTVSGVTIALSGGGTPIDLAFTFDAARPNRILATVPAGTPPGVYDVSISTDLGCSATLAAGLTVTDTTTLALEAIDPPFGWTAGATAVSLTATDPPPAGTVPFAATPRAYLDPVGTGLAQPMRSVVFVDAARLTAVVPSGLAEGTYDVIVVNPTGEVGVLSGGFSVGALPPPVIVEISPASVVNSGPQTVTATGSDFRNPTASLDCVDPGTGAHSTVAATVAAWTATSVDVTVPADTLPAGTVCVVRLTNDDGTYADFSALSVTNPAANLQPFAPGTDMLVARRAPASVSGRATRVARFVYAIGGDDGSAAGALSSAEAAPVDLFGTMGSWRTLTYGLPGPRTLAGVALLGRYVYLVGGNDGTGPVGAVWRAKILDPVETPEVVDLDLRRGDGTTGLGGGTWHYRVSAVMPAADPDNPAGESLPSDPLVVLVPALPELVRLTIYWTGVAGAASYRIYRTAAADDPAGTELLLGELPAGGALSFEDTGLAVGTEAPLQVGDTGSWAVQPALTVPREAPGVAIAADPTTPGLWHLYAVAGRGAAGVLRTYEHAAITVAADSTQTLGPWTADAANLLPAGRSQLMAFAVDRSEASRVAVGATYLYAAAGADAAGATVRDTNAALVQAGGTLAAWQVQDTMTPGRAGYGAAAANNRLYVFGGQGAAPSTSTASAEICAGPGGGCTGGPPELVNWNALGLSLNVERYLTGSAVESAFIFLVGGQSTGGVPTASTELTVW
ncbi:MAG: IPT/TIG domain-containing protein [Deltaproteobacteria bacterium]|nr:IPT/TIG domain-containing protein [Deltaproteobacteria bacterium]